jgi:O-antigen/teichoic acid export membrane protein
VKLGSRTLAAIGHVLGASTMSRGLGLARGLIVAKLLPPQLYGVSTAVAVIVAYAQYADLGSSSAAYRDLTSAIGRNAPEEATKHAGWMGALKLTSILIVSAGAVVASLWPGMDGSLVLGLWYLPFIALASSLLSLSLLSWQAYGQVGVLSRATTLAAFLDFLLGVTLTRLFGLPGLLVALAVAPGLTWAWAIHRGGLVIPRTLPTPVIRGHISTGLPLVALGLIDHNLVYLDHIVVLAFFSLHDLGVYNIGLVAADLVRIVGVATGIVLGPGLIRHYARSDREVASLRHLTLVPVHLLASLVPFVVAGIWIGGGYFLVRFYPSYSGAVGPMRVLLIAFYFLVINGGVTSFLFAIDKHRRNLFIAGPAVVLNVVLDLVLIRAGLGLLAVALGSLLAFVAYTIVHLGYVASHFSLRPREWVSFFAGAFLPGAYLAAVLYALGGLARVPASLGQAACACAVAGLLLSPLAVWGWRMATRLDRAMD